MQREEFRQRRLRLAGELPARELDAAAFSSPANVRYFSGFTGSSAWLILSGGASLLLTDPRYGLQAAQETSCDVAVVRGPLIPGVARTLRRRRLYRIGFEEGRLAFLPFSQLRGTLPKPYLLNPLDGLAEQMRATKSPAEIQNIRASVELNSRAYGDAMRHFRIGMTELDLACEIDYRMRRLGAEKTAFDTIVAAGPRSALPHARAGANPIGPNQLLLVDMGASLAGYASDMTRVVFTGKRPGRARRLYDAVLEAQRAALAAVREGLTAGHVDRAARGALRRRSLDRCFLHSTGHGLGLEIHEPPRLGRGEKTRLLTGMVITVEPGAYVEGLGGVRIEDTVVVTKTGCEVLTPTAKEWTEM